MLKEMYPPFYTWVFHNVSLWEKVFLSPSVSRDDIIRWFGHCESWPQSQVLFLGGLFGPSQAGASWLACRLHWIFLQHKTQISLHQKMLFIHILFIIWIKFWLRSTRILTYCIFQRTSWVIITYECIISTQVLWFNADEMLTDAAFTAFTFVSKSVAYAR